MRRIYCCGNRKAFARECFPSRELSVRLCLPVFRILYWYLASLFVTPPRFYSLSLFLASLFVTPPRFYSLPRLLPLSWSQTCFYDLRRYDKVSYAHDICKTQQLMSPCDF